jgi:REP element-mobilizing transposase RayT
MLVMAWIARLVVPGIPHHVTQRGNRRETMLFGDSDDRHDRDRLGIAAARAGAEIRVYRTAQTRAEATKSTRYDAARFI